MRTMSWEEIDNDWGGLQKKHRMEIAQAVARYCVGHKIKEIAERLGYSDTWVNQQLNFAGVGAAIGQGLKLLAPGTRENTSDRAGVERSVERIVKEFGPSVEVKLEGQGGNKSIAAVQGKDADAFQPYLDHYVEQGHEPAAAVRLAKAEWAAESAVEAGVIKEDVNKRNERVNRILFPDDQKDTFELDLQTHIANVKRAARFLDEAKVPYLKRQRTCEMVASAHEKWLEQVERVLNFNANHL
jgi:hypothetical protein